MGEREFRKSKISKVFLALSHFKRRGGEQRKMGGNKHVGTWNTKVELSRALNHHQFFWGHSTFVVCKTLSRSRDFSEEGDEDVDTRGLTFFLDS